MASVSPLLRDATGVLSVAVRASERSAPMLRHPTAGPAQVGPDAGVTGDLGPAVSTLSRRPLTGADSPANPQCATVTQQSGDVFSPSLVASTQ